MLYFFPPFQRGRIPVSTRQEACGCAPGLGLSKFQLKCVARLCRRFIKLLALDERKRCARCSARLPAADIIAERTSSESSRDQKRRGQRQNPEQPTLAFLRALLLGRR